MRSAVAGRIFGHRIYVNSGLSIPANWRSPRIASRVYNIQRDATGEQNARERYEQKKENGCKK